MVRPVGQLNRLKDLDTECRQLRYRIQEAMEASSTDGDRLQGTDRGVCGRFGQSGWRLLGLRSDAVDRGKTPGRPHGIDTEELTMG